MGGNSSTESNSNNPLGLEINPPVFWTSAILIIVFLVLTLVNVKTASEVFSAAKFWVCE